MRQIIHGMRYDTETATLVASFDNGYDQGNFHYLEEDLYITGNGAWFIAGSGNALTRYAISYGDVRVGGEEICPITPAEAMAWLEEHHEVDALETYFAEDIVDA